MKPKNSEDLIEITAEVVSAALGTVVPGLGVIGKRAIGLVVEERARRISLALAAAERVTGLSREELDEAIAAKPETVPLLVRMLSAAGNNGHDDVLKMIGGVFARAMSGEATLESQEVLLLAIEDLTAAHIEILVFLNTYIPNPDTAGIGATELGERLGKDMGVIRLLAMGLSNRALIEVPWGGFGGGEGYRISDLGRTVLAAAREANL